MFQAIAAIGKSEFSKLKKQGGDLLDILVEDVSGNGTYSKGIFIVVEERKGEYFYGGIELREYDEQDKKKYLYRAGSPRGTDLTATAKLTEASKTFKNKIIKSLDETANIQKDGFEEEIIELKKVKEILERNTDAVIYEIEKQKKALNKKEQAFLSLLVRKEQDKFVGDYAIYRYKLVHDTLKKYYFSQTYNVSSKALDKTCSICFEKKEVNGLASPFTFTTFDKLGYISGGFQRECTWRNVPICQECALNLELGKKFLDEYLKFSFFGMNYYVIPKPIEENEVNTVLTLYKRLKNAENFSQHQKTFITTEERIIRRAGEEINKTTLNLMFFEENQNAFNILTYIEDVLPSRLKFIFSQIEKINGLALFKKFRIQKEKEISVFINFKTLNDILNSKTHRKYFLECIYKIFKGDKISYSFLMNFVVQDIIQAYNREERDGKDRSFRLATISNYGLLYLLKKMDALNYKRKEGVEMLEADKNIYNLKDYKNKEEMFEDFFIHQSDFFNEPIKRALFLQGYLAQKLINLQHRKNEGRTPFKARLKGLKLNDRDIKRLVVEIRAKFDEYEANYYKQEKKLMSQYLMASGNNWEISNLDLTFYFALGMNMVNCFITNDKEEEEEKTYVSSKK